jgi:hypothetical protein
VAAAAGLKPDVIVQVGRYQVSSLNDFGILWSGFGGKVSWVVRNDRVGYAILSFKSKNEKVDADDANGRRLRRSEADSWLKMAFSLRLCSGQQVCLRGGGAF